MVTEEQSFGIIPLHSRVVVQYQTVEESMSKGGIFIPPSTGAHSSINTYKAEVRAAGEDATKVDVGDLILCVLGVGDLVDYDGERYVIIDETEILALLDRR